jgi:hypothetical protein
MTSSDGKREPQTLMLCERPIPAPRISENGGDQTTVDIDEKVAAGLIQKVWQRLQPDAVPSLKVVSHFRIGNLSQRHKLVGGFDELGEVLQIVGVQKLAHDRDTI